MSKEVEENIPFEALQHYEELRFFADNIKDKYIYRFKPLEVFRTVRSNPPTEEDLVPLKYQNVHEEKSASIELSQELVDMLSESKKEREVSIRALSVNDTLETSIEKARESYKLFVAKGHTQEEIEAYKKKRGTFVTKLRITPDVGIITRFFDGHADVILYSDTELKKIWDPSIPVVPFEYEEDDETSK